MADLIKLTEMQLDALKELGSIGAGHAATALSQLVGMKISLTLPQIKIVPIEDVPQNMGNPDEIVAGICFRIIGEVNGSFLFSFPKDDALILVDLLLHRKHGHIKVLSDLEQSALKECSNILAGAYLGAWAQVLGQSLIFSTPRFALDMAGAIVDFILIELSQVVEYALMMEIEFKEENDLMKGHFFILPNPSSLDMLLKVIDKAIFNARKMRRQTDI